MTKRFNILLLLVFLTLIWSCGGGTDEKKESKTSTAKKTKKYSLKTREGMMKKLEEFGIQIPKALSFVEIKRKSSDYSVKFINENVDETSNTDLRNWHSGLFSQLTSAGWTQQAIRVDEEMFGSVYNQSIFMKPRGGGSTLSDTIDITTAYSPDKKKYTLYISPGKN